MNQEFELPSDVDVEKELLAALLVRNGEAVPAVAAIVSADDFYRPEHRIIFRVIVQLYAQGTPPNPLSIIDELRKTGELEKVDSKYLLLIFSMSFTNAYAEIHAKNVKTKSDLRRLLQAAKMLSQRAYEGILTTADIIAEHQRTLEEINRTGSTLKSSVFVEYFAAAFDSDVAEMKTYAERKTGFENIDEFQFFTPGLYVIGATPAAGKTTFCWQLLEQLARKGETCIYCSYEMSRLNYFLLATA